MDGFHDSFLPTSSWADTKSIQGSSLVCATASDTRTVLPEPYIKLEQSRVIQTDQMLGDLQFHEFNESAIIFTADDLKYGLDPSYSPIDSRTQREISNHFPQESHHENQILEKSYSFQRATGSNQAAGSLCMDHGSIRSNDSKLSVFPHSLEDSRSASEVPPLWTSAYPSVVPSVAMDHVNFQNFGGFQGVGRSCSDGEHQKGTFQTIINGQNDLHNAEITSFATVSQMNSIGNSTCMPSNDQSGRGNSIQHYASEAPIAPSQPIPANANGTPKQRRARRGQATDPHSIAERLRREKIAERMKSLQELVPNSSKTDKASMLDEIIDYVKFLQLQAKVLSVSRVGAAGAVVPLISDIQPEETGNLPVSPSADLGGNDPLEPDDNLEFERELVKLMESNITSAMQYLQTKGLCLMPTALAAAISSRKGSTTAIPPVKKEPNAPTCNASMSP